jgi:hypothetical protein
MSADPGNPAPDARSRRARSRVAAAVVAGAGVLLVASTVVSWHNGDSVGAGSRPITDAEISAECQRLNAELNHDFVGEPVQRLVVERGASKLRVYVSEADNWISVCRSNVQGVESTFGTVMEDGPADRLRLFGGWDAVGKANVLFGHLPAGATTVKARLASGQVVTGTDDGEIFVIWTPQDSVEKAQITAYGPRNSVIAETAASGGS